jgi:hypothetical protein
MDPITYARLFPLNKFEGENEAWTVVFKPETQRSRLVTGSMGSLGDIPIIQTKELV